MSEEDIEDSEAPSHGCLVDGCFEDMWVGLLEAPLTGWIFAHWVVTPETGKESDDTLSISLINSYNKICIERLSIGNGR